MKTGDNLNIMEDKLYINGNILTMTSESPVASGFAVTGNRFRAVGTKDVLRRATAPQSPIVDLGGRTVIPGFIETHCHLSLYAITQLQADCRTPPNQSIQDVLERISNKAAAYGRGNWVRGWGFDDTLIDTKQHLTRGDLDAAAPHNPVFISHASGHLAYVNSEALRIAGIGPDTHQPINGVIHKDGRGLPTGLLMEDGAMGLVTRHFPAYDDKQLRTAMKKAVAMYFQAGITSAHDAAIGYFQEGRQVLRAYHELALSGQLKLRVYLTIVEKLYRKLRHLGIGTGFGSPNLRIGAVKFFQDGSIQAYTAALSEPYFNKSDIRGDLLFAQEDLDRLVAKYHSLGDQIAVHANGNLAIESVLLAFEKAQQCHPRPDARHMLVHCQLPSLDHIRRMRKIGVIPTFFANHIHYWGDRHERLFLGPERAARINPLATASKEGLAFTLHSDLPITPVDPLFSIHCAVNRITREGRVIGDKERISPADALLSYTRNAAYCSFEEMDKGTIQPGKLADFIILSDNPLGVSSDRIKDIRVLETVVGGRSVFKEKNL